MAPQSATEQRDSVPPHDPLADVPELNTYMTTNDDDKVAALKLVADSVAQMRNVANNSLIFHPLNLAILVAIISFVIRYMVGKRHQPFTVGTTCTGILMISLVTIRYITQDHLWAAEKINREWLANADVIVTKFGDEVIGTVMIDWVSGESRQRRKKAWRGEIVGWTVRLKYRRKGVGKALLEEAMKESRKKGAETIEFADEHASKLAIDVMSERMLTSDSRFKARPASILQW
jgi:ribosomal protein S18 acetylase RimI-like enzyme